MSADNKATDEWCARQLKRAHPERGAGMSDETVRHDADCICNHVLEPPLSGGAVAWCPTCKVFRHVAADKPRVVQRDVDGTPVLVDHGNGYYTVGRERPLTPDFNAAGMSADNEPRERNHGLLFDSAEVRDVFAAVLAEVARQDAGSPCTHAGTLEYVIHDAAHNIREAIRLQKANP